MKTTLRWPALVAALVLASTLVGALPAAAQNIVAPERTTAQNVSDARRSSSGHVYLLRGLLNIFSLGMDDLTAKLQARGVSASVHNHAEWESLANEIAAKYKAGRHGPIVLVGHSLGADAVMFMGEYLGKKGVPVALIVPFDGTGSYAASSNVARVMNLTQRDYAYMRRGSGFRGELQNIDVSKDSSIDHINIDKSSRLHNMVVNKILSVLGRGSRPKPAATDTSASSGPSEKPAAAKPAATPAAAKPAAATSPSTETAPKPAAASSGTSGTASSDASDAPAPAAPAQAKPRLRL